jgi:hypothetical protein
MPLTPVFFAQVSYVAPFEGAFSIKVEIGPSQSGPFVQMAGSPFQVSVKRSAE